MRDPADEGSDDHAACLALVDQGVVLDVHATLDSAMPLFSQTNETFLPVVGNGLGADTPMVLGRLYEVDALRAFNEALVETAREEHS
jgi:CIC family chloride channel protein